MVRIDRRLLLGQRRAGANLFDTFRHVYQPHSLPGCLAAPPSWFLQVARLLPHPRLARRRPAITLPMLIASFVTEPWLVAGRGGLAGAARPVQILFALTGEAAAPRPGTLRAMSPPALGLRILAHGAPAGAAFLVRRSSRFCPRRSTRQLHPPAAAPYPSRWYGDFFLGHGVAQRLVQ